MTRLLRLPLLLAALAASALALGACGGEDSVDELLAQTFGPNKAIKSGKLDLSLQLDLSGLPRLTDPVTLALNGPFESNGTGKLPDFDLSLRANAGGQSLAAGAVSTGEKGYLKFQGAAFDVGDDLYAQFRQGYERAQKKSGKDEQGPSFESLGIKPLRWLRDARRKGEEDVGGAKAIHITARVDVARFLDDVSRLLDRAKGLNIQGAGKVPGGLSAKQRRDIARSVKSATVDVYTGEDDKTLRRLRLTVALDVPTDVRKDVGGLRGGTIAFALTIADLNKDQSIAAPRDARPLSELTAALQQLGVGGGGGGGATAPPTTQTTPTTPSAPPAGSGATPKEYLDCLTRAGDDVREVQKCASLLN